MKFSFSRRRPRSWRDGERSTTAEYIKLAIKSDEDNRNKGLAVANQRRLTPRTNPDPRALGVARAAGRDRRVAGVNSRVNRAKH